MGVDNKVLKTYDEVSLHNNPKDCWVIINAKVRIKNLSRYYFYDT